MLLSFSLWIFYPCYPCNPWSPLLVEDVLVVLGPGVIDVLRRVGAVEVLLEVGVAVPVGVLGRIRRVVGVEPVLDLPPVGHAVAVAVPLSGSGAIGRPAAHLVRLVDDAVLEGRLAGAD